LLSLLGFYAFYWEPNQLTVKTVSLTLPHWPPGHTLRIAAIGDIHGGSPYIDQKKLRALVELTNRQKPDAIVLLGDYVILGVLGGNFMSPEEVGENLSGFSAPLGVFAVLGNHDWWYSGPRVHAALERAGYRVLEDEVAAVPWKGEILYIAGISDEWTHHPDVEAVLKQIPVGAPTVIVTHGPDLFPRIPAINGVTLAAHTHGGQVRLPFMGAPIVPSRYRQRFLSGVVRESGRILFVTSGVGTSILPVRFRVPPEVAVVTLNREEP
jgi:predicted MPP superfamily phosphohydrolase